MMKQNRWLSAAILGGALAAMTGCALFGKNAPLVPRYFDPEVELPSASGESRPPDDARLRLGRIQAGKHLRELMVYRTSTAEVGYYNDRRWTERPEVYLRRALSRSLFEVRGITRAVSGAAPTLDAELLAFEELTGPEHKVRVQVVLTLDDTQLGSLQRTITVERDVDSKNSDDPEPVVQALSLVLGDAVVQVCDQVVEYLAQGAQIQEKARPGSLEGGAPGPKTSSTF